MKKTKAIYRFDFVNFSLVETTLYNQGKNQNYASKGEKIFKKNFCYYNLLLVQA